MFRWLPLARANLLRRKLRFTFTLISILLATGLIALAFFQGYTPAWVAWLTASTTNVLIFGIICAGVAALFFGFGKAIGGKA